MKMKQASLVAPTLCPRCDASAPAANGERRAERCPACSLPLSWCGNCRGVAGPFDHFCGFCGFELIRGEPRSPVWRLGAFGVAVLLAGGLVVGLWAAGVPVALRSATRTLFGPAPAASRVVTARSYSPDLGVRYSAPDGWATGDGSGSSPAVVVLTHEPADQPGVIAAQGDLTRLDHLGSGAIVLGRPAPATQVVAGLNDPVAVLTAEVAPLVAAADLQVEVVEPIHGVKVGSRPAAIVLLKLTRGDGVMFLRRTLVYAPHPGLQAMFQLDVLAPAAEWPAVDATVLASITRSLSFT